MILDPILPLNWKRGCPRSPLIEGDGNLAKGAGLRLLWRRETIGHLGFAASLRGFEGNVRKPHFPKIPSPAPFLVLDNGLSNIQEVLFISSRVL